MLKFNLAKFENALAFQVVDFSCDSNITFVSSYFTIIILNNNTSIDLTQGNPVICLPKSANKNDTYILYLKTNDERDFIYTQILNSLSELTNHLKNV